MMRVVAISVPLVMLLSFPSFSQEAEDQEVERLLEAEDQKVARLQEAEDQRVARLIERSYDLAYSGLFDESKIELINALHNEEFKDFEPPIRFALGQICYEQELLEGAKYQWGIIVNEFPDSEEAHTIKNLYNVLDWVADKLIVDQVFWEQYEFSKIFWHSTTPDLKMDIKELYDPVMALKYLEELEKRYEQGSKKALILYDIFLLVMGYNNDKFGFHNLSGFSFKADNPITAYYIDILNENSDVIGDVASNREWIKYYLFKKSESISDKFNKIEGGYHYYVGTQFLLAVSRSGTQFLSSKIRLKPESKPYLQKVMDATEGDETNIYRLFALKWLSELEKKAKKNTK
jgi:hypothetical protein